MKKFLLTAVLVSSSLNFQTTHSFNYNKGYEDGYLQACRMLSRPDIVGPCMFFTMIGLGIGAHVVESVYNYYANYYIDTPKNILLTIDLLRAELAELKIVLENKKNLEASFLMEYASTDVLVSMKHFNDFPQLNRHSKFLLLQILKTIKKIIVPLQYGSTVNLVVVRRQLYQLVNELYLSLAQDLPNNDLGNQIKTQLKLNDDIAQFLLA